MKAVVLDPGNEFNVDRTLTKDDVQKLIRVRQSYQNCIIQDNNSCKGHNLYKSFKKTISCGMRLLSECVSLIAEGYDDT